MQSLTISSRGKGIEGETVVIHFISSLWRKGEEEQARKVCAEAARRTNRCSGNDTAARLGLTVTHQA